jgi:hypothetical protein
MTERRLQQETIAFHGTGGVSAENGHRGFRPAFLDQDTHDVYLSCFADGRLAPFHLLDGLPDEVVLERAAGGRVKTVKPSVISGFVLNGCFLTREEAAARLSTLH